MRDQRLVLLVGLLFASWLIKAAPNAWSATDDSATFVKAFPTAEGFGANAVGGRGGRIIEVTNLNDSGPGSLRQAVEVETGRRIVVFRVGGTIELNSIIRLRAANSYVTVAGQTAPGGIQLKNYGLQIRDGAHDVILRHVRVRPGSFPTQVDPSDVDGMTLWGSSGTRVYNVMVDHCSIEWAVDENANVWDWVTDATFQWCLIAEGTTTGHPKGPHGSGILAGGDRGGERLRVSLHHNLLAHNMGRNPFLARADIVDFRNNVVYNWAGNNGFQMGYFGENWTVRANFVNNHYLKGPNVTSDYFLFLANGGASRERGGTKIYVDGNWAEPRCSTGCQDQWNGLWFRQLDDNVFSQASEATYRVFTPFDEGSHPVVTDPTYFLRYKVLTWVGATKPFRDSVDGRIISDVRNKTGDLWKIGPGGPWPTLGGGTPPADADRDGMPDSWELAHGLNPNDPGDGRRVATNGYTNVENYLNELAGDRALTISPMTTMP